MINILSIDWDYYIDTNNDIRNEWFPDIPEDILSEEDREKLWQPYYEQNNLRNIGILFHELDKTKSIIRYNLKNKNIIKAENDSHRYLYDLVIRVMQNKNDEQVSVFNIDHHHDMYQYRKYDEKVNCSNWVTILQEELAEKFHYYWIKREDSEEYSLAGKIECDKCSLDDITNKNFDVIFICKSGAWSPPHLDHMYEELREFIFNS